MLKDNHGRVINYVRLAVTDRCNLRCFYCMPENGIKYLNKKSLLSFEEMYRILKVLSHQGISKLRITGGEPFIRKGIMEFLQEVSKIDTLNQIHITTNGTFTQDKIESLERIGIKSINLSLDSLDKENKTNLECPLVLLECQDQVHLHRTQIFRRPSFLY